MTTEFFVLARAVHFGACLLFFALYASDRLVLTIASANSSVASYWPVCLRAFSVVLLPFILISGIAWFGCVARVMGGKPLEFAILKTVWAGTEFGTVFKVRLLFWFATTGVAILNFSASKTALKNILTLAQVVLSGCLLGSLAWAGHGRENSPWHLPADVLHLLAAGFWPSGLLPLALILNRLAKAATPADWRAMAAIVRRFSTISLGCVTLLTVTGVVNSWSLLPSFSSLFTQPYGRWLSVKITLFILTMAIGAINLLRLKPRLCGRAASESADDVVLQLRRNVLLEIILGTVIVFVVAILGTLPP